MKKVISINKEMKENGIVTIPLENGDAVIDFDIENYGELTKEESERIWVTIKNCYDEDGDRMEDFKIFMSLKELNDEADGVIVEL